MLDRSTGQLHAGRPVSAVQRWIARRRRASRLCELLSAQTDADATVHELLAAAIEAGSRDNITAVIVDVVAQSGSLGAARDHQVTDHVLQPLHAQRLAAQLQHRKAMLLEHRA